jgi:soluble lytic murein transglycosylase
MRKKSSLSFIRPSYSRRKHYRAQIQCLCCALLPIVLSGVAVVARYSSKLEEWVNWHPSVQKSFLGQWIDRIQPQDQKNNLNVRSAVLPLVSLSPGERRRQLELLARLPKSQDNARARYLLVSDLIQQKQGEKALALLQGLEQDYPLLSANIALRRAQAYEVLGDHQKAALAWQDLLARSTLWYDNHPDNPVAAEALFVLGHTDSKYWDQAIAQFPSHPRTLEIVRFRLKQNPHQPQLLLLLAKYADDRSEVTSVLDQLAKQPAAQLKPEDWELIAARYWQNHEYDKAAKAYAKAPPNPRNAYQLARSRQLSHQQVEAAAAYLRMIDKYPQAKETGTALLQLAKIEELPD